MDKENRIKKVARFLKSSFDIDGINISLKNILKFIEDKGADNSMALNDPMALKEELKNSLSAINAAEVKPSVHRKKAIEDFMVENWQLIQNNDVIRSVLLEAYTKGRLDNNKRMTLKEELLNKCNQK